MNILDRQAALDAGFIIRDDIDTMIRRNIAYAASLGEVSSFLDLNAYGKRRRAQAIRNLAKDGYAFIFLGDNKIRIAVRKQAAVKVPQIWRPGARVRQTTRDEPGYGDEGIVSRRNDKFKDAWYVQWDSGEFKGQELWVFERGNEVIG